MAQTGDTTMGTGNVLTPSDVLLNIGESLRQNLKDGHVTLGGDLPNLGALRPVFGYLFDDAKLQLSDATLDIDKHVRIAGTAAFYGLIGVPTRAAFELRDERIHFRLTAAFPRTATLALPGIAGISVSDLHLSGESFLDDRLLTVYLGGTLHVQGTEVPIQLQFPIVSEDWVLKSTLAVRLPQLSDLAAFIGDEMAAWVPAALAHAGAFELRDLQMVFRPGTGSVQLISARLAPVASAAVWNLIPGRLLLRKPAIALGVSHLTDNVQRNGFGSVTGILSMQLLEVTLSHLKAQRIANLVKPNLSD